MTISFFNTWKNNLYIYTPQNDIPWPKLNSWYKRWKNYLMRIEIFLKFKTKNIWNLGCEYQIQWDRSNHGTVRELMPSGFTLGTSKLLHSGNSLRKPSSRLFLCQEIYMDILFHSCSLLGREELFEKLNKWRIMIRSNCASKTWAKFFL